MKFGFLKDLIKNLKGPELVAVALGFAQCALIAYLGPKRLSLAIQSDVFHYLGGAVLLLISGSFALRGFELTIRKKE